MENYSDFVKALDFILIMLSMAALIGFVLNIINLFKLQLSAPWDAELKKRYFIRLIIFGIVDVILFAILIGFGFITF